MTSVWVYEKTCPTCREPLTVGGGVSMEKTSPRARERSNRYVPSASHRARHFASSPSRAGFSGSRISGTEPLWGLLANAIDLVADHALGDVGHHVADDVLHGTGREPLD